MNWADYDRGLIQQGDVRFWIGQDVIDSWIAPIRRAPGGQRRISNLSIEATLTLGAVYRLSLRQTEGIVRSLLDLMCAGVPAPDHTTLSRQCRTFTIDMRVSPHAKPTDIVLDSTGLKFYAAGEWARHKHGEKRRP